MRPLLKIQSIPIKIEAQTRRASFQYNPQPAPVTKSAPLTNNMARSQVGGKPSQKSAANIPGAPAANQAEKAVQQRQPDASRNVAQGVYSNSQVGPSAAAAVADTVIGKALMADYTAPAAPAPTPSTSVDYQMDKPTFDWSTSAKPQLEFVPAQIEYTITQYPQLIIEYVGEPIYVPQSANPKYKGTA